MDTPPLADAGTACGVRDALAGGKMALAREREIAAHLLGTYPRLGQVVCTGLEFHRRAALWAVTGSDAAPPAAGVVFVASGFPAPGEFLHERAAAACPSARFVYADADPRVYEVNASVLAVPGRVFVMNARALVPSAVFRSDPPTPARALARAGPVSVHAVLSPARWPPALAAATVAGYASLLPPGSTVCLSLVVSDPGPAGEQLTEDASLAGGPGYAHTPADVQGWIEGAGMRLHSGGVRPARAWGRPSWTDLYRVAPQVPGRAFEAIGIVG